MTEEGIDAKAKESISQIEQSGLIKLIEEDLKTSNSDPIRKSFAYYSFLYAEDNLKVSKLINSDFKALSIYHLQQSIEHLAKGYSYLLLGVDETKRFNHNTFKILTALTEHFAKGISGNFFESPIRGLAELQKISKKEIARKSEKDINEFIAMTEQISQVFKNAFSNMSYEELRKIFRPLFESIQDRNERAVEEYKEINRVRTIISKYAPTVFSALFLGFITYPHEAFTRYPDGDITPEEYKRGELGIIKAYDHIYSVTDLAIKAAFDIFLSKS